MNITYSSAYKEQALVKVYSRGNRTIQSVAEELNVKLTTLKTWMKIKLKQARNEQPNTVEKRPQDWRAEEQLLALQETYGLTEKAKHAWCRERGLFAHHLLTWKAAFCKGQGNTESSLPTQHALRELKEQNHQLKRELTRKEKALAEAAALLILQKKFQALWEDEAT